MTIAQIVHDNEMYFGLSEADIHNKVLTLSSLLLSHIDRNLLNSPV